jgi:hypothetical protein
MYACMSKSRCCAEVHGKESRQSCMKLKFHLKTKPHHHSEENKGRVRACKELWLRSRGTHHSFLPTVNQWHMDMDGSCSLSLSLSFWSLDGSFSLVLSTALWSCFASCGCCSLHGQVLPIHVSWRLVMNKASSLLRARLVFFSHVTSKKSQIG